MSEAADPVAAQACGPYVSHLECSLTGERLDPGRAWNASPAGAPILVRYDLDRLGREVARDDLAVRPAGMWRYRPLLPLPADEAPVSLGECETPLIALDRIARTSGATTGTLVVKDEGRLPTGSFKSRGLALAVAMARHFGITRIAMPTAGNAGAALAAYASRAGIESYVFTPADTPTVTAAEIAFHGAHAAMVDGIISDCGKVVDAGRESMGWFDFSTLKEPYRIEGKKTMGLELADQLGWTLPDVIFYPTGGGTGLIGMWKAFEELRTLGWVSGRLPRMVAVQSTRCGPVVSAWKQGLDHVPEPWAPVETTVHGVRVAKPFGDRLILAAVYASDGFAVAVDDDEVHALRAEIARTEGLNLCPEGAACVLAWRQALAEGRITPGDRVVAFNCASGLKSPMPALTARLPKHGPYDFGAL